MTRITSPSRPRRFKKLKLVITSPDPRKIEITGRLVLLHKATHKNVRKGMFLWRRMPLLEVWELKCGTTCLRSSYTEICSATEHATVDFFHSITNLQSHLEFSRDPELMILGNLLKAKLQEEAQ